MPSCPTNRLYQFVFPPSINETFCCCTSLLGFDVVSVFCFYFSHYNRCVVIFLFNLHFPDDKLCWSSLHMLYFPSVYLFCWGVYSNLVLMINWVVCFPILSFKSCLYVLNRNPLSDQVFCKYCFLACGLSFHSLNNIFCIAEALNFNNV